MKTFLFCLSLLLYGAVNADPITCLTAAESNKDIAPSPDFDARQRILLVLCKQAKNAAPVTCYKKVMKDKDFPWPPGPWPKEDSEAWGKAVFVAHICGSAESDAPLQCIKTAQKDKSLISSDYTQGWWNGVGYPSLCGGAKSNAPITCLKKGLKDKEILQHKRFPEERLARLLELSGQGFDPREYPEKYNMPDEKVKLLRDSWPKVSPSP